jgi:hypothetical protein
MKAYNPNKTKKIGRPVSPKNILKGLSTKYAGKAINHYKVRIGASLAKLRKKVPGDRTSQRRSGVHSFFGKLENSKSSHNGEYGLFIQSVKGQKGKMFVENALNMTLGMYKGWSLRNDN